MLGGELSRSQEAEIEIRVPSAFLCSQSPLLAPGVFPNHSIKTCAQQKVSNCLEATFSRRKFRIEFGIDIVEERRPFGTRDNLCEENLDLRCGLTGVRFVFLLCLLLFCYNC